MYFLFMDPTHFRVTWNHVCLSDPTVEAVSRGAKGTECVYSQCAHLEM